MSMNPNAGLHEMAKIVQAFAPALPSTAIVDWVSLSKYHRLSVIISVANATTVTGSAVALVQATDVAGTGSKPVAFDTVWANLDASSSDDLVKTAVVADTFTTDATNTTNSIYVLEVIPDMLDVAGGFDCFSVTLGDGVATTIDAVFIMYAKMASETPPSAIVD